MALTWPSKRAEETIEFTVDWTARLAGDTIQTSAFAVLVGSATIPSQAHTTAASSAFIEGGVAGETAVFSCTIVTAAGQTLEETIVLPIAVEDASFSVEEVDVYRPAEDIDRYMVGGFGDSASAWLAADGQTKQRAAIQATRILNRQEWLGTKTSGIQPLAWPRANLSYQDGTPVDPATIPEQILDAACELAAVLLTGSTGQFDPSAQVTRSLKAGSVAIEYFRNIEGETLFPQAVMQLVGLWLGGGSGLPVGSLSSGTGGCTIFNEKYDFNRGF